MRKLISTVVLAAVFAASAHAHHASSSIDLSAPIWVKGTVVRFDRINPHTIIELDERVGTDTRRWRIEGPFLARLTRMGVDERFLEAGNVIEACGFPLKDAPPDTQPLIHGHVLVLPNGVATARRRDQPLARAALPLKRAKLLPWQSACSSSARTSSR